LLMNPMEAFKDEMQGSESVRQMAGKLLPKIGKLMKPSGVVVTYPKDDDEGEVRKELVEDAVKVVINEGIKGIVEGIAAKVAERAENESPPPGIDEE